MVYPSRLSVFCDECGKVLHGPAIPAVDAVGDEADLQAALDLEEKMTRNGWRHLRHSDLCRRCAKAFFAKSREREEPTHGPFVQEALGDYRSGRDISLNEFARRLKEPTFEEIREREEQAMLDQMRD